MVAHVDSGRSAHYAMSMFIIGVLFFIFGFVTWLNSSLMLFVKVGFNVDNVGAFLIPAAFYLSYFFLALPSAVILKRTGMKKGMALGLLLMAVGSGLFALFMDGYSYHGALAALFVVGAGLALLQTSSNPYVSILGPIESGAKRVAIMGICNKVAGGLAPIVFGALLLGGATEFAARIERAVSPQAKSVLQHAFVSRAVMPYVVMAVILVLLAVWILFSSLPEIKPESRDSDARSRGGGRSIFSFPHLWLGVLCLFIYVGMEVMAGDGIVIYGQSSGLTLDVAKHLTTWTMFGMLVGYLVGVVLTPRFVSQQRYLAISAVLGIVFALGAWALGARVPVSYVAVALGFANAMMWPAIFPLAIKGLGGRTEFGSALLIMGIAGGALIPQVFAYLETVIDFRLAFMLVLVPGYLFILYYGLHGHRAGMTAGEVRSGAALEPETQA